MRLLALMLALCQQQAGSACTQVEHLHEPRILTGVASWMDALPCVAIRAELSRESANCSTLAMTCSMYEQYEL